MFIQNCVAISRFCLGEFSLVHGKTGWRVVSVRADKNLFEEFRNSPNKLKIVCNILNLVRKLISEEEAHTPVFNIIYNFLFFGEGKGTRYCFGRMFNFSSHIAFFGLHETDPELSIPISSSEIDIKDLEMIAPRRFQIISLINESLKAT